MLTVGKQTLIHELRSQQWHGQEQNAELQQVPLF